MGLVIVFLYLTYVGTKYISKKVNSISNSKYIKIIDKAAISQNKFLIIVEVGEERFLLSVSENNINILKELDKFTVEENEVSDEGNLKFSQILKENILNNKVAYKLMKGKNGYEVKENFKKNKNN